MAFWLQQDKTDQAIEPLLFLTPRHICFILSSSSDTHPLGEISQATYKHGITPFSAELQKRTYNKTLQWQQTNKALTQANKLI